MLMRFVPWPLLAGLLLAAGLGAQPGKAPKGEVRATVTRLRLGPIALGAGGSWGRSPYGWYDPFLWGGMWHGGPYAPWWPYAPWLAPNPALPTGTVRLKVAPPQARVILNGAFAGTVEELRELRLPPGVFQVQFDSAGFQEQQQKMYILSGKTMRLEVTLQPQPQGAKP